MQSNQFQKIFVIGNAATGKTIISRALAEKYHLPLFHVDTIQFLPGMKIRPLDETRTILKRVIAQPLWIIDGFGPLDMLEERFLESDVIIYLDLPVYISYWWAMKRQIQNLFSRRKELPLGCNELSIRHTKKLFMSIHKMHTQMQGELRRILMRPGLSQKVVRIDCVSQWRKVKNGSATLEGLLGQ